MTDLETIDANVARDVMGYGDRVKIYPTGPAVIDGCFPVRVSPYSSDMQLAWLVVGEVLKHGYQFEMRGDRESWVAEFSIFGECEAQSAPQAICRAALRLVKDSPSWRQS